jgi:hypothetical protein
MAKSVKIKKDDNEPVLVGNIKSLARDYKRGWQGNKEGLQLVADLFHQLSPHKLQSSQDLHRLINDTDNFIFDLHSGGHTEMFGKDGQRVEIDKAEATRLYKKPQGYEQLVTAIHEYVSSCINNWNTGVRYNAGDVLQYFSWSGGAVIFSEAQQYRIDHAGDCHARTEKGKAIYRFLIKLSAAFIDEGLDKFCTASGGNIANRLPDVLLPLLNETLRGIDRETKSPIVEMQGTATSASFAGDRMFR